MNRQYEMLTPCGYITAADILFATADLLLFKKQE